MVLSHFSAQIYPTAWQLGLGLLLVLIALFARNGILGIGESSRELRRPASDRVMTASAARRPRRLNDTSARSPPRAT